MGSVGGHVALPWAAVYCASKFALHSLSDSLHRELKREGIHVAKVCPGIVRTDFRAHVLAGEAPGKVEAIRRTVSPEQVAVAIADSVVFNRTLSYVPPIGRFFRALDFFAPAVMDWFLDTKLDGRMRSVVMGTWQSFRKILSRFAEQRALSLAVVAIGAALFRIALMPVLAILSLTFMMRRATYWQQTRSRPVASSTRNIRIGNSLKRRTF